MADKAIFLIGPTAVGKTELALRLAEYYPLEIISVDSALIYRGLDIGSAKPTAAELARVPHHLIDIISPLDSYSVADFLRATREKIREINQRGKLALLVGGTMMYYHALIAGISQLPEADSKLREWLTEEFNRHGNLQMHQRLTKLDPVAAAKIEINDVQRVNRALEVCLLTGRSLSQVQEHCRLPGLSDCNYLSLALLVSNRKLLQQRINLRFEKMLQNGFVEEVIQLRRDYPNLTAAHNSMRCVGYRQAWDFLDGKINSADFLAMGQAATRQLAKRQLTWLRSMDVLAIDDPELNLEILQTKILAAIRNFEPGQYL